MSALSQSEANVAQNLGRGRSKHRNFLKIETSLMPDQSLEEDPRVSIVGNLVISKTIVDLKKDKGMADDVEPRKISDDKNTSPLQPVRKSCYSFVNKLV